MCLSLLRCVHATFKRLDIIKLWRNCIAVEDATFQLVDSLEKTGAIMLADVFNAQVYCSQTYPQSRHLICEFNKDTPCVLIYIQAFNAAILFNHNVRLILFQ